MTQVDEVSIRRRFGAFLLGALALVTGGLFFAIQAWIVAGVFLAALAGVGARAPRSIRVEFRSDVSHRTPNEGQLVTVRAEAHNPAWRPALVEWKLDLPGISEVHEGPSAGVTAIRPKGSMRFEASVQFLLFGLHHVGPMRVRSGDVFGFAVGSTRVGVTTELRVYPRAPSLQQAVVRAKQLRALFGAYEVPRPGHGFEFFGLRSYVPGDRPRDINWKASARHSGFVVNQHEKENDTEVVVFFDARAASLVGRQTDSPFAQGGRAALAVAGAHLRARDSVRFIAYGSKIHRDVHTGAVRNLQAILNLIVGLEPEGDMPFKDVVDEVLPWLRRRSPIVVVSCLTEDPTLERSVARLRAQDLPVHVLVPVPNWGDVPEEEHRVWDAAQMLAIRRLRQLAVPIAELRHDKPISLALRHLEAVP